jgi:hypothetical protein
MMMPPACSRGFGPPSETATRRRDHGGNGRPLDRIGLMAIVRRANEANDLG